MNAISSPVRDVAITYRSIRPPSEINISTDQQLYDFLLRQDQTKPLTSASNGIACVYLLSHHDDGVVWGKLRSKGQAANGQSRHELTTSASLGAPFTPFRVATLQECRLFSTRGEWLLWREEVAQFKA